MDEGDEEEIVNLDDSCSMFVKEGVPGAAEIEEGVGIGREGPVHLHLEELDTGSLSDIEARGTGVAVSGDLEHIEGVVGDVRYHVFKREGGL